MRQTHVRLRGIEVCRPPASLPLARRRQRAAFTLPVLAHLFSPVYSEKGHMKKFQSRDQRLGQK